MIHQVKFITHSLFWTGAAERTKGLYKMTGANKDIMNLTATI